MRLQRTRWSRLGESAGWALGTDRTVLEDLIAYWATAYDWRRHEVELNELLPQRRAQVRGVDLHFVHVAARRPRALPLVLLHGAADSFLRYRKVVRELALDFEVIVPSLPGFALTGPVALPERQPTRYVAELVWELVHGVLGCERFAIAGGDYGGLVAQILAIDHAESVVGVHLGDVGWHVTGTDPETVTFAERRWLDAAARPLTGDGPCARLAATRPRSVAAALSDSPVGLASWIADRWHAQSGNGGISRDDLLATAMLYWATNTIGSALDAVAADRRSPSLTPADYVARPVALAVSAHDPTGIPPRRLAERTLDIAWWTELPCASQLAALEDPERYAADVGDFFRALRERRESRKELRDDRLAL